METKTLGITLLVMFLAACGGSSSGSDAPAIPVNSTGYPDVAGYYSFNTQRVSYECTTGERDTLDALALNFTITQEANQLSIFQGNASEVVGLNVLARGEQTANIEKNGHFISTYNVMLQVDGIPGDVRADYNLDGRFTQSGWSGHYTYTAFFLSMNESCKYKTSFRGDKVEGPTWRSKPMQKVVSDDLYFDGTTASAGRMMGAAP